MVLFIHWRWQPSGAGDLVFMEKAALAAHWRVAAEWRGEFGVRLGRRRRFRFYGSAMAERRRGCGWPPAPPAPPLWVTLLCALRNGKLCG